MIESLAKEMDIIMEGDICFRVIKLAVEEHSEGLY